MSQDLFGEVGQNPKQWRKIGGCWNCDKRKILERIVNISRQIDHDKPEVISVI